MVDFCLLVGWQLMSCQMITTPICSVGKEGALPQQSPPTGQRGSLLLLCPTGQQGQAALLGTTWIWHSVSSTLRRL